MRQAIKGCYEPVFHKISVLIPRIQSKPATEWKKNPESVLGRMYLESAVETVDSRSYWFQVICYQ